MQEQFKIKIEIDGQTVKADCRLELGRFLYLTMTAPYKGIKTTVLAFDTEWNIRQFYDLHDAQEKAREELRSIMAQINYVKQFRAEYTEASNHYQQRYSQLISDFRATNANCERGSSVNKEEIAFQVLGEYVEMINKLIPINNIFYLVSPDLLVQILKVI